MLYLNVRLLGVDFALADTFLIDHIRLQIRVHFPCRISLLLSARRPIFSFPRSRFFPSDDNFMQRIPTLEKSHFFAFGLLQKRVLLILLTESLKQC